MTQAVETFLIETRKAHPLPAGRCWLVVGPSTWGKAFNLTQAWVNATSPKKFLIYDCPPCGHVDDMGGICWYPHLYKTLAETTDGGKYPNAHSIDYPAKEVARYDPAAKAAAKRKAS